MSALKGHQTQRVEAERAPAGGALGHHPNTALAAHAVYDGIRWGSHDGKSELHPPTGFPGGVVGRVRLPVPGAHVAAANHRGVVLVGVALQSWSWFLALGATLWWS